MGLAFNTALVEIQDALHRAINLALRKRLSPVADLEALRAAPSRGADDSQLVADGALCSVESEGRCYAWDAYSALDDDDSTVIVPSDAMGDAGRWIRQSIPLVFGDRPVAKISDGYLCDVQHYSGVFSEEEFEERIYSQRPCVVIYFKGRTRESQSMLEGQLARGVFRFELWAVSFCMRPEEKDLPGPPLPAEAQDDPGSARIAGDLETLLDGATGDDLGLEGVAFCRTSELSVEKQSLAGRLSIMSLQLDVLATIGKGRTDAVALSSLEAQELRAEAHGTIADRANHVRYGLTVATGSGMIRAPSDGEAMIGDVLVSVHDAPLHTFTGWCDTYRWLDAAGAFHYVGMPIGASVPAPPVDGALLIGVTTTDDGSVTEDRYLTSTVAESGDPFSVL